MFTYSYMLTNNDVIDHYSRIGWGEAEVCSVYINSEGTNTNRPAMLRENQYSETCLKDHLQLVGSQK